MESLTQMSAAAMPYTELNSKEEYEAAISNDKRAVVMFTMDIGPAKHMKQQSESLMTKYGDNIKFYEVDMDKLGDLAQELGINEAPVFCGFVDGKMRDSVHTRNINELDSKWKALGELN